MRYAFLTLLAILLFSPACRAGWWDSNWTCRRSLPIVWDDEHATGNDLASCVFYTDGHAMPNGEDVRVTTEDGKLVASHVLMVGPGDRIRVVFAMEKGVRNYFIYFGNPNPTAPPPGMDDVKYKCGLLLETRQWTGGAITNADQLKKSFERSKPELGRMMIDQVFLGYNPFGPQEQWISKFSGEIAAPQEDDYFFAVAADDAGALYIDGKPLVWAPLGGADIRYHATVHLTEGPHEFVVYHANFAASAYISVGWRRVSQPKIEIIHREAFGVCYSGVSGPLEIHNKNLVADFGINQMGECFFADGYSYHFRFTPRASLANAGKFEWNFGDGQTSDKSEVDHVYITDGIYPVKLTAHMGPNTDTQTVQLAVSRNWAHILDTRQDQPQILSGLVKDYDIRTIPESNLPRLVQLCVTADTPELAGDFADSLAAKKSHPDSNAAFAALNALEKKLVAAGKADAAVAMWDKVPADSDIQPFAARRGAEMSLWWTGDIAKAVHLLQPFAKRNDPGLIRQYAQALILSGHADEGKKLLESQQSNVPPARRVALSGAAARNVEFFITNNDPESGEEAWDRWQARFPSDFLEGYSVLLRTKLMEQRKRGAAAASVAEAFANAVPLSPYAPQLLDRASKLLASTDAAKSQALHQQLKQKYPEDPLSQD